jgi:hypothetical protein
MSSAWSWLAPHVNEAPAELQQRIRAAVEQSEGASVHAQLAHAANICLRDALAQTTPKNAALHLLSADALLTHACAAAAEAGSAELGRFTAQLDAQHFQGILDER